MVKLNLKSWLGGIVIAALVSSTAVAGQGSAESNIFTIDNRDASGLNGTVLEVDSSHEVIGPLSGATVTLSGEGTSTTGADGKFSFLGLDAGSYSVSVSKAGYYPVERVVVLGIGETRNEVFRLTAQALSPSVVDTSSPNGKHLIEGMPGNLTFEVTLAWNGSPGAVYFHLPSGSTEATVTDLGGGLAQARLTVPAPASINACSELTVEVVNGEGERTYANMGVRFYPIPGMIIPWYRDNITWTPSGLSLSYSDELSKKWELPLGGSDVSLEGFLGYNRELKYDLLGGVFSGSIGGFGGIGWDWEVAEVEILGEGKLGLNGTLNISLAGCVQLPRITPGWEASFKGKAGVGAPAVLIVDIIFPPASPVVHYLLTVPVVKDVVGALKLRLFVIFSGSLSGEYEDLQTGECFLGTSSLDASGTFGLEGQTVVELWGAEAGLYTGGTGTPEFEICPDLEFQGITFRAYVGVFASAWLFEYSQEVGAEVRFDTGGEARSMKAVLLSKAPGSGAWRPIGTGLERWGESNRLVGGPGRLRIFEAAPQTVGSVEEKVVENVTRLGCPSSVADESEAIILFSLYDPNKPWHAATDIGSLYSSGGGPWSLSRISDDDASEFAPAVAGVDQYNMLATWERVSGDISDANGPSDVAPHLEIVASWYNRNTQQWSTPAQLTSNDVVDRNPLPVVFGVNQGIMWVQNDANEMVGNPVHGDRLMFAEWSGADWGVPQTLWSAKKGVRGIAMVGDGTGEADAVFVVDEDGDVETKTDRELYWIYTQQGTWQTAVRLTNDGLEDALPVLVSPNGIPVLVWRSGSSLLYTALDNWNPREVYGEYTPANEASTLDGVTMPAGAAVAYTVQREDGVDIMASFYDNNLDQWSLPRQLTHDEHVESSLSLACDGTGLLIGYLKTQTERNDIDIEIDGDIHHLENVPQPARTDLYVLRHSLGYDLAVDPESVVVEPSNPAPGSSATITATIENRGDLKVQDAEVAVYDGDPNAGGIIIGETQIIPGILIAGGQQEISVSWEVPTAGGSHDIFIVVDPNLSVDDRNRSNNIASHKTVLPDFVVESCWSDELSNRTVSLTARIINEGVAATEAVEVSWRLMDQQGEEIGTVTTPVMAENGAYEATYTWDASERLYLGQPLQVFAVVDAPNTIYEYDESNNSHSSIVYLCSACPKGDLNLDYDIDFIDFAFLANHWKEDASSPNWSPACDISSPADGSVDWADLAVLTDQWLHVVP